MCQHFHIRARTLADRSRAPGSIAALTDKHDTAEQFNGPPVPPAMHKSELHGLWLAKNCVAFLRNSHVRLMWQLLEGEAKGLGATLEISDHPTAIALLIL